MTWFPCSNCIEGFLKQFVEPYFASLNHSHDSEYASIDQFDLVGSITLFAGTTLPEGWLECNGSTYSANDYPALANALGPGWSVGGGLFAVPDLRGKFVIGASTTYPLISQGGEASHTLTVAEMPAHNHELETPNDPSGYAYVRDEVAGNIGTPNSGNTFYPGGVASKGGGEGHNNLPPYMALRYIIYSGVT